MKTTPGFVSSARNSDSSLTRALTISFTSRSKPRTLFIRISNATAPLPLVLNGMHGLSRTNTGVEISP